MIRNIILDIGNVLVDFCWEKHLRSFGFPEETVAKAADALFLNRDWEEVDRGVLTREEIVGLFIENDPSIEEEIRLIMKDISGTIELRPYTQTLIPQLQGMGYKVYLLSNFSDLTLQDGGDKFGFIDQADGAILSFRYHFIKPDPRIYEQLLSEFSLEAQECLFFDDAEKNVVGARACGLNAEVFTELPRMFEQIEEYRKQ